MQKEVEEFDSASKPWFKRKQNPSLRPNLENPIFSGKNANPSFVNVKDLYTVFTNKAPFLA